MTDLVKDVQSVLRDETGGGSAAAYRMVQEVLSKQTNDAHVIGQLQEAGLMDELSVGFLQVNNAKIDGKESTHAGNGMVSRDEIVDFKTNDPLDEALKKELTKKDDSGKDLIFKIAVQAGVEAGMDEKGRGEIEAIDLAVYEASKIRGEKDVAGVLEKEAVLEKLFGKYERVTTIKVPVHGEYSENVQEQVDKSLREYAKVGFKPSGVEIDVIANTADVRSGLINKIGEDGIISRSKLNRFLNNPGDAAEGDVQFARNIRDGRYPYLTIKG